MSSRPSAAAIAGGTDARVLACPPGAPLARPAAGRYGDPVTPRASFPAVLLRASADALPVILAVMPIGALFGTLALGRGLAPSEAFAMSATIYAAASQFVALDLLGTGVPAWSIVLSVLAVNLRHLLYSAAMTALVAPLRPLQKVLAFALLVDPLFAYAQRRGAPLQVGLFFAHALVLYAAWLLATALGLLFGRLLEKPDELALDLLMPAYFLALVMGFRTRANWGLAVGVSATVSVLAYHGPAFGVPLGPPWHITLGAFAGVAAAALLGRPERAELS